MLRTPLHRNRGLAVAAVAALTLSLTATLPTSSAAPSAAGRANAATSDGRLFARVATFPVFANNPADVDPSAETVAEISDVTQDGRTVIYTDAPGKRIGFLDISDPKAPKGLGTLALATLGHADDQPTSVAVVGEHALVAIDETGGDFDHPKGSLVIVRIADRTVVRTIDLGGQPDSIAVSPDGSYAAVAMENQRDEEAAADGGGAEGDLPQAPAGSVVLLDVSGAPSAWGVRPVALTQPDGSPLASFVTAGLDTPSDPEPEYATINDDNKLALTLQENNGVVVIDVATGAINTVFSAGTATVTDVDTTRDGLFNATGSVTAPREPDAIGWVDERHVATANEGDWKGGTRGWTVFDTVTGTVAWDAGNSFEQLATAHGLHNNARADKKGAEPEGLTVARIGGKNRAFVGSERSNFVAVYDLSDPTSPVFERVLPTTNGPEGLLAIPERDLLVVSSETDEAEAGVRASLAVHQLQQGRPAFPSVVSTEESNGLAIGWGALGALSAAPGNPSALWAASDSAYATARLYKMDVSSSPARIERVIEVREADGKPAHGLDVEGLHARAEGGFWAASEGATGADNALLRLDSRGRIRERVTLPAEVSAQVGKWGLEGVTATGTGADEVLHVVLQRPLFSSVAETKLAEGDVARIGRYQVATGTWSWFTYPLSATSAPGDWMGLSEITAVDGDTLAVIERDKLNGPRAAVKQIQTVDLPATGGTVDAPVALRKKLALDVLPRLRALNGWTQEKLEGLTIGADGNVYAVTDNDGLKDATGETQFLRLGAASKLFAKQTTPTKPTPPRPSTVSVKTKTSLSAKVGRKVSGSKKQVRRSVKVTLKVSPGPSGRTGTVVLRDAGKKVAIVKMRNGRATVTLKLRQGKHSLKAHFRGTSVKVGHRTTRHLASSSKAVRVRVR